MVKRKTSCSLSSFLENYCVLKSIVTPLKKKKNFHVGQLCLIDASVITMILKEKVLTRFISFRLL